MRVSDWVETCGWQNQFNYLSHCRAVEQHRLQQVQISLYLFSGKTSQPIRKCWGRARKCWMYENSKLVQSSCMLYTHRLPKIYLYRLPSSTNDSCGLPSCTHVVFMVPSSSIDFVLPLLLPLRVIVSHLCIWTWTICFLCFTLFSLFYDNSFLWCFIILTLSYHKVIHVRRLSISGWFHDVQKEKKKCVRWEEERN